MSEITRIHGDWDQTSASLQEKKEALEAARAPLAKRVAEFTANKPTGMFGKLSYAFTKATKISSVNRKIGKLDQEIFANDRATRNAAADTYRQLGEFGLANMTDGATLQANYDHLKDTRKKWATAVSKVNHAISESKEASDWEVVDMASNNLGMNLLSYMETDEAAQAIKDAGAALSALNKNLREQERFDKSQAGDIQFDNNLDLFVDVISDFAGIFTSWSNMKKLDNAVEKMQDLQKNLGNLGKEIDEGLRHIQTVAIQATQKQHPEIATAVQAVKPFLPADTQATQTAKPQKFQM